MGATESCEPTHGFSVLLRLASLISLFAGVLVTATAAIAAKTDNPFSSRADVLAWIGTYREDPAPSSVPDAVKAMAALGIFQDVEQAGVFIGFVAGVTGDNQVEAEDLIAGMFPMRPEDQIVIVRAIADSGLPNWQDLMRKFIERMPARQILIREYLDGERKPLQETPLDKGPDILDAWWGIYFATGRYEPIRRIIPALAWADEKNNLEQLTVGSMAMWTLASNSSRDKLLLDFLRDETYRQPSEIAKPLAKLVKAAETFEANTLRKEQVAKIEELKQKGPEKGRQWAWWSRAASTAIALGCVVAGATGQVALGLPCLIGGTVSSAAEKLMQPGQ